MNQKSRVAMYYGIAFGSLLFFVSMISCGHAGPLLAKVQEITLEDLENALAVATDPSPPNGPDEKTAAC